MAISNRMRVAAILRSPLGLTHKLAQSVVVLKNGVDDREHLTRDGRADHLGPVQHLAYEFMPAGDGPIPPVEDKHVRAIVP
jgi:hypothetical protein